MLEPFNLAKGSASCESLAARSALGATRNQPPEPILDSDRLRIAEEPFLSIISLRSSRRQPDNSAVGCCLEPLGLSLPEASNGLSGNAQLGCCRFEPKAWLLTGVEPLLPQATEPGVLATTVSDRLVAFRLSGPAATQLIAAGCDPAIVRSGACARTRFAGFATVLIQRWDDQDYRLLLDVSIARSFAGWLLDASRAV